VGGHITSLEQFHTLRIKSPSVILSDPERREGESKDPYSREESSWAYFAVANTLELKPL
jgi:hypothetical protein